ncbi:MAG: hypothetical protein PVG60_05960 [Desulfarculaceae bacterium]|jgi:hypothetical protein
MLLNELAGQLGLEVRLESLEDGEGYKAQGGFCRIGDRLVAFVDRRLPPEARARQLGSALSQMDLNGVYVRPAVRDFLEELKTDQT